MHVITKQGDLNHFTKNNSIFTKELNTEFLEEGSSLGESTLW
jgi:hypothetical protein